MTAWARLSEPNSGLIGTVTIAFASATSSVSRPERSGPNRIAVRPATRRSRRPSAPGVTTGMRDRGGGRSRRRRSSNRRSPPATVSKTCACSSTMSAPLAEGPASGLGQPSRGATSRISVSPKLSIARAALPMFWPSCGRTRTMTGLDALTAICRGRAGPLPFPPARRFRRSRRAR